MLSSTRESDNCRRESRKCWAVPFIGSSVMRHILRIRLQPILGVHGFAALAYFKIQLRGGAAGVAQGGDHVARSDPVAHRFVENLGVAVPRHVAAAGPDDEPEPQPL